MSFKHKKVQFSVSNSRIHFGNLIYEAAKQSDWEGLELILAQDGGQFCIISSNDTKIIFSADEHVDFTDKHGKVCV